MTVARSRKDNKEDTTGATGMRLRIIMTVAGVGGLALLIILVMHSGVNDVAATLGSAGWALLWLIPVHIAPIALDAVGWRALLHDHRQASLPYLSWIAAVRDSINSLLPVARVGGEEFVVSSPYTNRLAAIVLAERLRKAVESLDIQYEGSHIPVTISIGIALQPQDGDALDTILAAADERLYIAKHSGRNRFCAADKHHAEHGVDVDMVCPKLDEALAMIKHGNLHRLMPHLPKLLENLIPLFELTNEESPVHIDVDQVREAIVALKVKGR